ncbi:MbtH family NRPS accessory protein [Streptomyces inhibens]|uniref:MbtH family NRPS accessory protein n=1 Tax=Streptomyces inhibens TaxID=2293571 RepID=UPI0037A52A11
MPGGAEHLPQPSCPVQRHQHCVPVSRRPLTPRGGPTRRPDSRPVQARPTHGGRHEKPLRGPERSLPGVRQRRGQHSLWPVFADVSVRWHTAHGQASRQKCLDHVTEHWTEMRPCSIAAQMDATA